VIGHTSGNLAETVVKVIVVGISVVVIADSPTETNASDVVEFKACGIVVASALENSCGTDANGPFLLLAKVEVEVETELEDATVQIVTFIGAAIPTVRFEEVTRETETTASLNLKETGLTLVTAKPIHKVDFGVTHEGGIAKNVLATSPPVPVNFVINACLQLEFQAQDGSDALGEVDAYNSAVGSVPIIEVGACTTFNTD
jgi:hypothetical protein